MDSSRLVLLIASTSLVAQTLKHLPPVQETQVQSLGSIAGSGRPTWRMKWQPTPVFLPGESHGRRSLVGYSPRGQRVGHDWVTSLSLSRSSSGSSPFRRWRWAKLKDEEWELWRKGCFEDGFNFAHYHLCTAPETDHIMPIFPSSVDRDIVLICIHFRNTWGNYTPKFIKNSKSYYYLKQSKHYLKVQRQTSISQVSFPYLLPASPVQALHPLHFEGGWEVHAYGMELEKRRVGGGRTWNPCHIYLSGRSSG